MGLSCTRNWTNISSFLDVYLPLAFPYMSPHNHKFTKMKLSPNSVRNTWYSTGSSIIYKSDKVWMQKRGTFNSDLRRGRMPRLGNFVGLLILWLIAPSFAHHRENVQCALGINFCILFCKRNAIVPACAWYFSQDPDAGDGYPAGAPIQHQNPGRLLEGGHVQIGLFKRQTRRWPRPFRTGQDAGAARKKCKAVK